MILFLYPQPTTHNPQLVFLRKTWIDKGKCEKLEEYCKHSRRSLLKWDNTLLILFSPVISSLSVFIKLVLLSIAKHTRIIIIIITKDNRFVLLASKGWCYKLWSQIQGNRVVSSSENETNGAGSRRLFY